MKISDVILDFLSETAIYEMVRDRQRAFDRLRNKSEILQDHIIKVLMFGKNTQEYNGWILELKAFSEEIISAMSRYKIKTGKDITYDQMMSIFLEYSDSLKTVTRIADSIRSISWKIADKTGLPRMRVIQEESHIHKKLLNILSDISSSFEQMEIPDYDVIFDRYV